MMMDRGAETLCPYCGEPLWIPVDPGGGSRQRFVSDCEVCCHPVEVEARIGPSGEVTLAAARDDAGAS